MTTCNLTKPESTFDQIKKARTDLKPTDVALIATALVEAGRHAVCLYDGKEYEWERDQYEPLAKAYLKEVEQVQVAEQSATTKKAKAALAEETVTLTCTLRPSMKAAERVLGTRNDLKTMTSDLIAEGIEYLYSPNELGWPWTLDRVNWDTLATEPIKRRLKFQAVFEEPSEAVELAASGKRKKR